MDLTSFLERWKGKEVVAFSGPVKFRGTLSDSLEGGFLILTGVAVINPGAQETAEYEDCVLNVADVSGIVCEETVGRGVDTVEEY